MRLLLRNAALAIFRLIGSEVVDQRTGKHVGRAFFFGWKGRIIVIGLDNEPPLRPIFLPQTRLTFWKQEIGFTSHPHPDFPALPPSDVQAPNRAETADPADERR